LILLFLLKTQIPADCKKNKKKQSLHRFLKANFDLNFKHPWSFVLDFFFVFFYFFVFVFLFVIDFLLLFSFFSQGTVFCSFENFEILIQFLNFQFNM